MAAGRNAPCPCGSGRKYKHCCLATEKRAASAARFDDAVGGRILDWTADTFGEEIDGALEEYAPTDRALRGDDLQIFSAWFHNDRELPGGGTPAERYAARLDLRAEERKAAERIASANLGLHRVLAVEPGQWIELEDVVFGRRTRVRSASVSRDAVRWDILLGRVMAGDPESLWGPARLFAPDEEPELLVELRRLAGIDADRADARSELEVAFRRQALELMRFRPPSRDIQPSYFTPEGDPMAHGQAAWEVREYAEAEARMRALGGLAPGEPLEIDLTVRRARLLAKDRPPLPKKALVIETSRIGDDENVPVATVRLEEGELQVEAMSEERLALAIEAVDADFGDIAELVRREITPIAQRLEERDHSVPEDDVDLAPIDPAERADLLSGAMTEWMHRWLDEPLPALAGESPREAAGGEGRGEVVKLLRSIENRAERTGRQGGTGLDAAWLRAELALDDELAA
ncbi:MAG: SEC-C domain-containing protein [Nitrososphaerota archaeon]